MFQLAAGRVLPAHHFPPKFSVRMASILSTEPNIARWMMTGRRRSSSPSPALSQREGRVGRSGWIGIVLMHTLYMCISLTVVLCMHMHIPTRTCKHTQTDRQTDIQRHTRIHTSTLRHTHTHTPTHMNMCACTHIHANKQYTGRHTERQPH